MTISDFIVQYEQLRSLLLGSEVGLNIELPRSNSGADGFDSFVSSSYVALRETLAEDASFLSAIGVFGKRQDATRSVYMLRTARQHKDNKSALIFYSNWLGEEPIDWDDAVERLVNQVEGYMNSLIRAAQKVRRDPDLSQQWVEATSVSVPSVFAAVCRDLNLSFSTGARQAKVRAIEARYRREHLKGPKRRVIADLCVQEVLSEAAILPADYTELLDELGLLRSRNASAVLALAYATARALPELEGDNFKRKTSEMWWALVQK
ncbi:hypothetical protein [Brevibacterium zhoupengii]|uniref:hypothetical protein n=1 Tax=Brevibacterium zhoupengii TaxID=2898795 RepID=UPI001E6507F5|nr:hypothetical protein [Brevibacterium zhoupengii]